MTDTTGNQYQTPDGLDSPHPLLHAQHLQPRRSQLSWPAIPGLRYDVLATTNLSSRVPNGDLAGRLQHRHPVAHSRLRRGGELLPRELEPVTPCAWPDSRETIEMKKNSE